MARSPFLALAAGCLAGSACQDDLVTSVTFADRVGTGVTVTWSTAEPATGVVEYGPGGVFDHRVDETTASEVHETAIRGEAPLREIGVRIVATAASGREGTWEGTFPTPGAPAWVPDVERESLEPASLEPGYILAAFPGTATMVGVLSVEGFFVWWAQVPTDGTLSTRALVARDGASIWYNVWDHEVLLPDHGYFAELRRVSPDGRLLETVEAPDHHHDFLELEDGTLTWIAYDYRQVAGTWFRGDKLVERAPDGTLTDLWTTWDTFPFDPAAEMTDGVSWSHANSLAWEPASGVYLVSVRNADAVVAVDRSGAVAEILGGVGSDWSFDPPESGFALQHSPDLSDDGDTLLVFDNGPDEARASRARTFHLDWDSRTLTPALDFGPADPIWVSTLGDVVETPGGGLLVSWGSGGRVDQLTPEGEVAVTLGLGLGNAVGFTEILPSLDLF